MSPTEWVDFRTRESFSREDIIFHVFDETDNIEAFTEYFHISKEKAKQYSQIISKIKIASKKCGNVRLISEQRLIRKEIRFLQYNVSKQVNLYESFSGKLGVLEIVNSLFSLLMHYQAENNLKIVILPT